jgi:DNA invertase Pin-like site-specific DNA recombinase
MRKAAVYLRVGVSTLDQTTGNQEHELREVANRMGCEIVKVYRDEGVSGAKDQKRPQLEKLRLDAYNRKFDMVMAWSIDRLGRSLQDLVGFLSEIHDLKIDLYLHKQGIDTTTPAGRAMFEMTAAFVDFERAMLWERLNTGLVRAKQNGLKVRQHKIAPAIENAIHDALQKGDAGMTKIAKHFGVGTGTVQRIKAAMTSSNEGTFPLKS